MRRRVLAGLAVGALLLAGCTDGGSTPQPPAPPLAAPEAPRGEIAIRACTPERSLLPAATLDACGLAVTDAVNARLLRPNPDTGQPTPDLAAAIETQDSQNFTVRLNRDRHFHDGTEVKARNFVSAWNWAAYGPNRMPAQTWFTVIEGGAEMNCPRTGACTKDGRPTALTGLKVVDDYTFTIRTVRPIVDLQTRLAHPVFSPLPDAFFAEDDGKDAFGRLPVGAGPFTLTGNTNSEITLEAFGDYAGSVKPKVQKVVLRKYDAPDRGWDAAKAYNDVVANSLDLTDVIPTDQLVDDVWKQDLPDRHGQLETQSVETLTFVGTDTKLTDPRLRRAISMAIDREALVRQVFAGTRLPARSWVSPSVPGYRADACGEVCAYNLSEARRLYREAGGYAGEFRVNVNADGGHKQWADAVCNQLKNALELDCQVNVLSNQVAVMNALDDGQLTGLVRQSRRLEYLSAEPFLAVYGSESRLNRGGYRNPAYDRKLSDALAATSQSGANAAYRDAELLLRENPPAIPLWFAATPYGWSNRVADVRISPLGGLDLTTIRRT